MYKYKFIKGNITSCDLLTYILSEYNITIVIHFAAQSHVQNSFSDSLQYTKDNKLCETEFILIGDQDAASVLSKLK